MFCESLDNWHAYSRDEKIASLQKYNVIELEFVVDGVIFTLRPWYEPWRPTEGPMSYARHWGLSLWCDGMEYGAAVDSEEMYAALFGEGGYSEEHVHSWVNLEDDPDSLLDFVDYLANDKDGRRDLIALTKEKGRPYIVTAWLYRVMVGRLATTA